jgi:cbb3-type cytochrome oxidase subunit 1
MDPLILGFIRGSVVYLLIGGAIGPLMIVHPEYAAWRFAHMHLLLAGFMAMMIFGVGYHVLPRFSGRTLAHPALARWHLRIHHIGLWALVVGGTHRPWEGHPVTVIGGVLVYVGFVLFALNVWRSTGAATPPG